jgi:preprotein translocase subunit SecE
MTRRNIAIIVIVVLVVVAAMAILYSLGLLGNAATS